MLTGTPWDFRNGLHGHGEAFGEVLRSGQCVIFPSRLLIWSPGLGNAFQECRSQPGHGHDPLDSTRSYVHCAVVLSGCREAFVDVPRLGQPFALPSRLLLWLPGFRECVPEGPE
jgi:hypothetical protein